MDYLVRSEARERLEPLAEVWEDEAYAPVDCGHGRDSVHQQWRHHGAVLIRRLIPEKLMQDYEQAWLDANGGHEAVPGKPETYERPGGWPDPVPYMRCPELLKLVTCPELSAALRHLMGEDMAVHLNLTGWVSTRRNWHLDQYLNDPHVGSHYCAAWIALETIDMKSGPFQYVPGSHLMFEPLAQWRVRQALGRDGLGKDWPTHSEKLLTPVFEQIIEDEKLQVVNHTAERGDVLLWHSKLLHRGSVPEDPTRERRALIAHFSAIDRRPDMPPPVKIPDAGFYFPIGASR